MYEGIWHLLPGNAWIKTVLCLVLLAAAVAALFTWVFPWAETALPFLDASVEAAAPPLPTPPRHSG